MKTDEQLLEELRAAAAGLLLMSETDQPLEPFRLEGDAGGGDGPDLSRLRAIAGAGEDAPVEARDFEEFFETATLVKLKPGGGGERADEEGVARLKRALADNLAGLRVYRVGEISVAVFVVGRSAAGSFLGLSTRVVET